VCPVRIPLPDLQRKLREKAFETGLRSWQERGALKLWSWFARRPALYAAAAWSGVRVLRFIGGSRRSLRKLPFGSGWTHGRDMPAPQGRTFRELYAKRDRT
ncbi:MAG: lactate utilization protein LutB domain-containing protein, partial [Casimicrobiaceae bacterium]